VKVALNLCALPGDPYVLDARSLVRDLCALVLLNALNVLCAPTFQSLALVQLSVGNVKREALNARGFELPSLKPLLDQYLYSDVLDALTLAWLLLQQLAWLCHEQVTLGHR
jgi:hypothetical protein